MRCQCRQGNGTAQAAFRAVCQFGQIAQLVEQRTENPCVGSSILPLATNPMSPASFGPGWLSEARGRNRPGLFAFGERFLIVDAAAKPDGALGALAIFDGLDARAARAPLSRPRLAPLFFVRLGAGPRRPLKRPGRTRPSLFFPPPAPRAAAAEAQAPTIFFPPKARLWRPGRARRCRFASLRRFEPAPDAGGARGERLLARPDSGQAPKCKKKKEAVCREKSAFFFRRSKRAAAQ